MRRLAASGHRLAAAIGRNPLLASALALAIRLPLIPFESGDYRQFLSPWYDQLRAGGGFVALREAVSNYTPPYLYLLATLTYLPLPKLLAIKLLAIAFDFALAAAVAYVVRFGRGKQRGRQAFAALLLAPTIWLNSALWGQSDALYTTFLVIAILLAMRDRPASATVAWGAAIAVKLQAIFLLPLFGVLVLRGRLPSWYAGLLPVVYVVAVLPAWAFGRPLPDLLLLYVHQARQFNRLAVNAPSLYQWLPNDAALLAPGVALGACAAVALCLMCWQRRVPLDATGIVRIAMVTLVLVPFALPKMHERYFFPADVWSIVYMSYIPDRRFIPVCMITASAVSYTPFLFGVPSVLLPFDALLVGFVLIVTLRDLLRSTPPRCVAHEQSGAADGSKPACPP